MLGDAANGASQVGERKVWFFQITLSHSPFPSRVSLWVPAPPSPPRVTSATSSATHSWRLYRGAMRRAAAPESSVRCGSIACLTASVLRSARLLVPLPLTSEQPEYNMQDDMAYRTHIHNLDDYSLLQIFSCYQLEDEDDWNLRLRWRNLAHVCRRWRYLIFDSSSHLGVCLLLKNGSPSIGTLRHLPPVPLVIDYSERTTVARKDEDNIYLGLQRHGRVRRVTLWAPSSSLRMWLEPMNKPFPRLEDLYLSSTTTEMSLVLPETFRAPFLRRLALHGIGLSTGLSILSSMISLSTLSLTHIQDSCYFPPGDLVRQLQGLYNLEELSIGFAIAIPLPSSEGELLPTPIPPVTLPALRRLTFRGLGVYLDNLVAQINTPLLERLSLTFLFDLDLILVNLAQFVHRTEGFGCPVAKVNFNKDGASIYAGYYEQRGIAKVGIVKLSLHVNCKSLDWQIDSARQVCSALGEFLSTVEELTLDLDLDGMSSDWRDTLVDMLLHELLLPFISVKRLHVGSSLIPELSQTLESDAGGMLLQELQELEVPLEIDLTTNPFSVFMKTRESVGRPLVLKSVLQRSASGKAKSLPDMINYIPPPPGPPLSIKSKDPRFQSRGSELGGDTLALKYLAAGSSIKCTLLHVKHGRYRGIAAALIVFEADFDFPAKDSRTKCATIEVSFSPRNTERLVSRLEILREFALVRYRMPVVPQSNDYRPSLEPGVVLGLGELEGETFTTRASRIVLHPYTGEDRQCKKTVSWIISENKGIVHPIFRAAIIVRRRGGLFHAHFKLRSMQACDIRLLGQPFIQEFGRDKDGRIRFDPRVNLQADGLSDSLEDIDLGLLLASQTAPDGHYYE